MGKHGRKELTPRRQEVFDWMKGFIREHGMPPTVREIGAHFGIAVRAFSTT